MNPDGSVSVGKLDDYINKQFPIALRQKAHNSFTPCLELVGKFVSNSIVIIFNKKVFFYTFSIISHDRTEKCS